MKLALRAFQVVKDRAEDAHHKISYDDFQAMKDNLVVRKALKQIGVDEKYMEALSAVLFCDEVTAAHIRFVRFCRLF